MEYAILFDKNFDMKPEGAAKLIQRRYTNQTLQISIRTFNE